MPSPTARMPQVRGAGSRTNTPSACTDRGSAPDLALHHPPLSSAPSPPPPTPPRAPPQGEDSNTNMRFLRIDCGPLKQTLVGHCEQWVAKFTGLLNALAEQELSALHSHFQSWCVVTG